MANLNKCIFIGRATQAPELKTTTSGKSVCNFSVAINEKYGEKESTQFVNIVVWNKLAEVCAQYISKGKEVYIESKFTSRSYEDKDGNKKYISEFVALSVQFIGGNSDNSGKSGEGDTSPLENNHNNYSGDDLPF